MRRLIFALFVALMAAACGANTGSDPLVTAADRAAALPTESTSTVTTAGEAQGDPETTTTVEPTSTVVSSSSTTLTPTTLAPESPVSTTISPEPDEPGVASDYCSSPGVGLRVIIPTGWTCKNVTTPLLGGDAFSLENPGATITVTIGSGDQPFACDLFGRCGEEPFFISDEFPDTSRFEDGGITEISGHHRVADGYIVIVPSGNALDDADVFDNLRTILDSTELL